jgi:chromosome partitioning protein
VAVRRVTIANSKGGVGKTTTVVCLAGALVDRGRRVLLIDLDPQASASLWLGVPTDGAALLDALLENEPDLIPLVHQLPDGFDIIPSGLGLTRFEASVAQRPGRDLLVRRALRALPERWDYVLVDTPGSFNLLSVSALAAADYYLLPIEAALLSTEPLLAMLQGIDQVVEMLNRDLKCAGVLACRLKSRANNPREILDLLREHVGDRLLTTVIHDNINLAEAPAHRVSIGRYMGRSRGAEDYRELAVELEARLGEGEHPRARAAVAASHQEVANG